MADRHPPRRESSTASSNLKADVWKYFGFYKVDGGSELDKSHVICKLCRAKIKYFGNTTNMRSHVTRFHLTEESGRRQAAVAAATSGATDQRTIEEAIRKLPPSSEKAKRITKAIAAFIAKDLHPYSVVENQGFRALLHTLEPRYTIPSRRYFTDTLQPNQNRSHGLTVKEILHEIVEEKTSATLRCPHSVEGNVIWSRESHGNKTDILTVNGDGDLKHIHDPGKLYSSLADKSLVIRRVTISDSGRYLCNNEPAVELTVIPSGTIRLNATEGTTITLTCPLDVGGSVPTWSRGSGEIQQEKGFYVSPLDNTLTDVQLGDSGLYYCDGKPAVYLTVIKGTKTPTTLTTMRTPKTRQTSAATPSKAAAPPPATTTVQSTTPLRTTTYTDATTAKKKHQNRKHGEKGKKRGKNTSTTTTTTTTITTTITTTTTTTTTTGTYESASKDHQPVLRLVCGVVFSFLVLIIIIIFIIYFAQRRRLKRQGNEERFHVYDKIQDGFLLQPTNGGGSLAEPTATYCMAGFSAGSNQNDPSYSTIPDLPPVQKTTNTSLHIESPYSLIGNTLTDEKNKGSSPLSDNTYFFTGETQSAWKQQGPISVV